MAVQVIGAGFGRTGTMSLQTALDILLAPGRCYHFGELMDKKHIHLWQLALEKQQRIDWKAVLEDEGFVATMDHPCADFYQDLMNLYPTAKVILSEHPGGPEKWYDSKMALEMIRIAFMCWPIKPAAQIIAPIVLKIIFRTEMKYSIKTMMKFADAVEYNVWGEKTVFDREHAIKTYVEWNEKVKACVPKDRLLVYNVKQGWAPLCTFLGKPQPDAAFPKEDSHGSQHIKTVLYRVKAGLWFLYGGLMVTSAFVGMRTYKRLSR